MVEAAAKLQVCLLFWLVRKFSTRAWKDKITGTTVWG